MLVLASTALALATFMNVLDTSIANVSIPAISGDLAVSSSQGTWVITSFAVANAIAVPLTGFLTQRFGAVRLFIASILLFVTASWLCGMATSLGMLIVFRVIQGAVAGPMIPLSQSLLLASYPKAKAGSALAIWSMTTLIAPVVGPLLGGWITDNISWPWIFYINVPIGLLAASVTWWLYRHRETPTRQVPIDYVGLAALIIWVGALQIMLDKGNELDWFASTQIVVLAIVAALGFCFFLVWELTEAHPIVDLSLLRRRNFWSGTLALAVGYGVFFGNVVLMPLWLQQDMGYTATIAGAVLAPVGLLAILFSPWVGKNVHKYDPRLFATVAFGVFSLILWMRSQFTVQTDFVTIMFPSLIQGIAMAAFFIPLMTLIFSGLTPDKIAAASGLSNFARITAGAIGASVYTSLWENRAAEHHATLVEHINYASPASQATIKTLTDSGMNQQQALGQINNLINQQAFTLAADELFWVSALLFIVLIGLIWLARPAKAMPPSAEAAAAH
ncbi:multidrug resistance protein [Sulfuriferula plumbiphila]|uniref:Multidrug resistance protein n=1 Tax=Sulfuriferula plumbiphila TaxID=171865 RepID=A0A512LBD6_9PROT|nr:DHA2 family efflux MFS transporter permease subunit [Sulfuriferula plumbiphila]BBP04440.1 multidrug resistance protein [Sulfuriferula plumbiphila]GEP31742.1 multidrug resistance protein [Sulfuriferula plumbiphila]